MLRDGVGLVVHFQVKGEDAQISMFPLRRIVKTKLWTKTGHAEQSEHYTRCNVFGAARHFLQGSATACYLVEWLKLQNAERSVKKKRQRSLLLNIFGIESR